MDGPPTRQDIPLDHFEFGSLEKVDPATRTVTAIFSRCLLTHCRVGERMSVKSDEGNIHTSNVVERRVNAGGYEVLTKSGTIYRFTRTESGQENSPVSLAGRLRRKVMRVLQFWKKNV